LPFAENQAGISATFTPWLKDIAQDVYLATVGGYYQLDDESAISGGLRYFSLGSIQYRLCRKHYFQWKTKGICHRFWLFEEAVR